MPRTLSRRTKILAVLLLAIAVTVGGFMLMMLLSRVSPTAFGWPAELTTIAGNGVKGHADGAGAKARFSDPFAIAIDPSGNLYVADAGGTNRIRKIDVDGVVTTLPGQFDTPSGLAIDKAGNIIVADTGANAIRRVSTTGMVTTLAGDGVAGFRDGPASQARFDGPIGVAVDDEGNIYVADSYNDRIRVITADGQVKTLAGGASPGFADGQGEAAAFDTPSGIILDRGGGLLVADTGNDAIRKVEKDGRVSTLARTALDDRNGLLKAPIGLTQTWDGFVYVASFRRGRIIQMAPSGELRVLTGRDASELGNADLQLGNPAGLALDRAGALYIADSSRYVVRKLAPRRVGASAEILPSPETALPSFASAANFPWPVAPQYGWHEVVGDMGEVRGNYQGESRDHLHAGLDIQAGVGETVLAVVNEKVADPLPNWSLNGLSEGLRVDEMTYIHMRVGRSATGISIDPARFRLVNDGAGKLTAVRIKRGTRFRVGDPLGTINRMAHVHLELGPPGVRINPLVLRFTDFTDRFAPRIESVQIVDGAGGRLAEKRQGRLLVPADSGALDIVVDAWDQVDGNTPRRRLGLYRAGFQILRSDGSPVPGFERPRINLVFDRMPLDPEATKIAYAAASGVSVHSNQPTRFLYVVSNRVSGGQAEVGGWDPAELTPGDYMLRIFASDFSGNEARDKRDLPITVN